MVKNVRPWRSKVDTCIPLSCFFPLPFTVFYLPSAIFLYVLCVTLNPVLVHVLLPPPSGPVVCYPEWTVTVTVNVTESYPVQYCTICAP